jgi:hypothetical protein
MKKSTKETIAEDFPLDSMVSSLRDRLGHANGALSDILVMITSSYGCDLPPKVLRVLESIVHRVLSSASDVHRTPSWFNSKWEEVLFSQYQTGEIKACASMEPSIEEAKRLRDASSWPGELQPQVESGSNSEPQKD